MPTNLGVEMLKLQEQQRHNKAGMDENIGAHIGSALGSAGIGALGKIGSAIISKNDISWYDKFMELLNSSAKLAWPYRKGQPINSTTMLRPSVMTLYWVPTIGTQKGVLENAPVMKAFKSLFNTVRGKNSGATNYDAVDLGIVSISIDTIQTIIEEAKRALKIITKTKELDPMTVKSFGKILGYDASTVITNKQDWINVINKAIIDLNSLMIPGGLSYFERHKYLANMMLAERDVNVADYKRTIYYVFRIKGTFTYDEVNGELDWTSISSNTSYTPSTWYTMITNLLSKLINSSTVAVMTGDIEGAVNRGAIPINMLHHMDPITEAEIDGDWPVIHDEQTLMQVRNATVFGTAHSSEMNQFSIHQGVTTNGDPFIYQGTIVGQVPQGIQVQNILHGTNLNITDDATIYRVPEFKLMYSRNDFPDEEEVMENSRLMAASTDDVDTLATLISNSVTTVNEHGSEIISNVDIWYYNGIADYQSDTISSITRAKYSTSSSVANYYKDIALISAFKYAPVLVKFYDYDSSHNVIPWSNYSDYNITTIFVNNGAGRSDLAPLHECALRSELAYTFSGSTSHDSGLDNEDRKMNRKGNRNKAKRKSNKNKSKDKMKK